jgi:type VI secretion system protein ImpA
MATPPAVDVAALLAPIPGPNPAGEPLPYPTREQFEELRKEDNPDSFAPNDPGRPTEFRKADWPAIVRLSQETLTKTSKDLLVAARLTEALVKVHGFIGLRDGMQLLRGLVEQCWDRIYPAIEDGDLEVRAGPFNWLDDPIRGARFPTTLRSLPIVERDNGKFKYGYADWEPPAAPAKRKVSVEEFDRAVAETGRELLEEKAAALTQCREDMNKLVQTLTAKIGPQAVGLGSVSQVVDKCTVLVRQILQRKAPAAQAVSDKPQENAGPATTAPSQAKAVTRADVYRQLGEAATVLRGLEPHSPIPYLLQRAVELGALSFPELIKELVRDANILGALNRELGIKDATPPKK